MVRDVLNFKKKQKLRGGRSWWEGKLDLKPVRNEII